MCYHLMQSLGGYFKFGSHWAGNSNIQKLVLNIGSTRQGDKNDSPFSFVTHFVTLVTLSRTGPPASLGGIWRDGLRTVPTSSLALALAVEIDQTLLNWLLAKPAPLE